MTVRAPAHIPHSREIPLRHIHPGLPAGRESYARPLPYLDTTCRAVHMIEIDGQNAACADLVEAIPA
ncbi:hypothetical protein GCM10023194_07100 [Planotetraspora phitsanulokensis]|uniref:Uncharacterized protein n=1 Tax=Planotetraspora phitsanulokensis TaxID=575192 RepID=A0A8J3U6V4_9ACTN|nr:hypothetical protein Pph01_42090 [Planotetraspora phitsanulokensis]